jgi:hypothetical protein
LTQSARAQAAFFDPPYNVRIQNNVSGLGAVQHRNFDMASGEMSEGQFTTFLMIACSLGSVRNRKARAHERISIDSPKWRAWSRELGTGARCSAPHIRK